MQQSVKIVNRNNLPQFLNKSMPSVNANNVANNTKSDSNPQTLSLREEPLVFMPDKFKMKIQNNSELFEKFFGSFENFLRLNPQRETSISEQIKMMPQILPTTDTDLQKEYESTGEVTTKVDQEIQKSINQNLKCYINACVSENLNERAFAVLMSLRRNNPFKRHKVEFNDPELYIDLMTKFSTSQNWTRVNEIYEILIAEKISITPQVYMNILDCLGRMGESANNTRLIREFINKAKKQVMVTKRFFIFILFQNKCHERNNSHLESFYFRFCSGNFIE